MMDIRNLKWSKGEKDLARRVFEAAYQKECEAVATRLKEMVATLPEPVALWEIHDYLSRQREQMSKKYDYRYSVLLSVFAQLFNEGWISEANLKGLAQQKIEIIKQLAKLRCP
jgi:hypothetical protein